MVRSAYALVFVVSALAGCGTTASPVDMQSLDNAAAACNGVASDGASCSAEGASCPGPCGPCAICAFAPKSCTCRSGHWECNHVDCSPSCHVVEPATFLDSSCSTRELSFGTIRILTVLMFGFLP